MHPSGQTGRRIARILRPRERPAGPTSRPSRGQLPDETAKPTESRQDEEDEQAAGRGPPTKSQHDCEAQQAGRNAHQQTVGGTSHPRTSNDPEGQQRCHQPLEPRHHDGTDCGGKVVDCGLVGSTTNLNGELSATTATAVLRARRNRTPHDSPSTSLRPPLLGGNPSRGRLQLLAPSRVWHIRHTLDK